MLTRSDHLNACEMKRLCATPAYRRVRSASQPVEHILDAAKMAGCSFMPPDTLSDMETARAVDQKAVFVEVLPSHHDPMAIARHMKVAF